MNKLEDKDHLIYVFAATAPHAFVKIIHEDDNRSMQHGQYSYWTNLKSARPWGITEQREHSKCLAAYNVTPENVPAECKAHMLLEGYPL